MRIAIVGAGAMGLRVAEELLKSSEDVTLLAVDASHSSLANFQSVLANSRVDVTIEDASNTQRLADAISGVEVVVNAAQYDVNRLVMRAALKARTHYIDLGGMFHETQRQLALHDEYEKAGLTAISGMGAAPGVTNLLAAHVCADLKSVDSVEASFGASVEGHEGPSQFVPPYSLRTIMQEYLEESVQFINGKHERQAPMSGARLISFPDPIGELECIYTLHSEPATLPSYFINKGIVNVEWRLGLPTELSNAVRAFASAGLGEIESIEYAGKKIVPIDFLLASIEANKRRQDAPTLPYTETGCLRVEATGITQSGKKQTKVSTCQRSITGLVPDMAGIITGVPCAVAALMLASGRIDIPGVHAPETAIPHVEMFEALESRGFGLKSETTNADRSSKI